MKAQFPLIRLILHCIAGNFECCKEKCIPKCLDNTIILSKRQWNEKVSHEHIQNKMHIKSAEFALVLSIPFPILETSTTFTKMNHRSQSVLMLVSSLYLFLFLVCCCLARPQPDAAERRNNTLVKSGTT